MPELLLPFARRNCDGKYVAPDEVPRGLACDCSCPGCGHPVQAKQGVEKVWHFAHAKAGDCQDGYEISVHELAKQLIRDQRRLLIPPLYAKAEARDAFGLLLTEQKRVFESGMVQLDRCELSRRRNLLDASVAPDITGHAKGREILVEITVFHRLMPEKQERLLQAGLACLHIDLGEFKLTHATRERIETALFEDRANRLWLYHPFSGAAEEELNARLERRVQESFERKRFEDIRQAELNARRALQRETELVAHRRAIEALQTSLNAEKYLPAPGAVEPKIGYRMQWRACLPDRPKIDAAATQLALRTGCSEALIRETVGAIQRRGQLSGTTPERLAKDWANFLGITDQEVFNFFAEGGFLSPY